MYALTAINRFVLQLWILPVVACVIWIVENRCNVDFDIPCIALFLEGASCGRMGIVSLTESFESMKLAIGNE